MYVVVLPGAVVVSWGIHQRTEIFKYKCQKNK